MKNFTKKFKTAIALMLVMVMANVMPVAAQPVPDDLIGIRELFEGIGGTVEWNGDDQSINVEFMGFELVLFSDAIHTTDVVVPLHDGIIIINGTAFMTLNDLRLIDFALAGIVATIETFYLTEEARNLVLYDFDFMVNFILENSPWGSVIYRRTGIDFYFYTALFRMVIDGMTPLTLPTIPDIFPVRDGDDARSLAANYLVYLIWYEFAMPLQGIGHIGIRDLETYRIQLTSMYRHYRSAYFDAETEEWFTLRLYQFIDPLAIWFYGEYEVDLDTDESPIPNVPGNINAQILVPGEVAYLRIYSFSANPEYDDYVTFPFLQEVRDFEHLILDLRGNTGGWSHYFEQFIVRRLISEPTEFYGWEFFRAGSAAMALATATYEYLHRSPSVADGYMYVSMLPAAEFAAQRGMTEFNPTDLALLDYALYIRYYVFPADDSIEFDGQLWLLIDGSSASASVLAAQSVLQLGGTLVGENTSGVMGPSLHLYQVLPNTGMLLRLDIGYIPDAMGRSLEVYGITPHYFNFPGYDALDTALALIAGQELEPAALNILGHWECQDDTQPHLWLCTLTFFENGQFIDRDGDGGTFVIDGNRLTLIFDDFDPETMLFRIEGNWLILYDDFTYVRLERQ